MTVGDDLASRIPTGTVVSLFFTGSQGFYRKIWKLYYPMTRANISGTTRGILPMEAIAKKWYFALLSCLHAAGQSLMPAFAPETNVTVQLLKWQSFRTDRF
jgi:hypothetical protein